MGVCDWCATVHRLVGRSIAHVSLSGGLDWDRTQIVFTKRTLVGKRDGATDLAMVPTRAL